MTPSPDRALAESPLSGRPTRRLLGIIALSLVLRVAAAFYLGNSVDPLPGIFDQVSYHTLALRVLEGHGFSFGTDWWPATAANQPTAHWSFLYVLFLSAVYGVGGPYPLMARLVQAAAVGVLQPLLTYRLTTRLFGARVGLVAAAVVACYIYFVYYAAALLTEAFYIVAILWSLDRALELGSAREARPAGRMLVWLQLGLALAAAVLLRQIVLVVVPIVLLWAWWKGHVEKDDDRGVWRRRRESTVGIVVASLVVLVAVLPWTVRNHSVFHRFVLLNTNAGFAFYWGNHPVHGTSFVPILPAGTYERLIPGELRGLDEAALERALMRRGFGFVSDDPARFLLLSASRIREYVKFWPSQDSGRASSFARVLSFGIVLPFMVGGVFIALSRGRRAVGCGTLDRRTATWLLLDVAGAYTLVHLLTWTLVRYRLPVDAVLVPFAALALVWVWDRLAGPRRAYSQNRAAI